MGFGVGVPYLRNRGFGVFGLEFMVCGSGCRVFVVGVWGLGFGVEGLVVWGLVFRVDKVLGFGFRVSEFFFRLKLSEP